MNTIAEEAAPFYAKTFPRLSTMMILVRPTFMARRSSGLVQELPTVEYHTRRSTFKGGLFRIGSTTHPLSSECYNAADPRGVPLPARQGPPPAR